MNRKTFIQATDPQTIGSITAYLEARIAELKGRGSLLVADELTALKYQLEAVCDVVLDEMAAAHWDEPVEENFI